MLESKFTEMNQASAEYASNRHMQKIDILNQRIFALQDQLKLQQDDNIRLKVQSPISARVSKICADFKSPEFHDSNVAVAPRWVQNNPPPVTRTLAAPANN